MDRSALRSRNREHRGAVAWGPPEQGCGHARLCLPPASAREGERPSPNLQLTPPPEPGVEEETIPLSTRALSSEDRSAPPGGASGCATAPAVPAVPIHQRGSTTSAVHKGSEALNTHGPAGLEAGQVRPSSAPGHAHSPGLPQLQGQLRPSHRPAGTAGTGPHLQAGAPDWPAPCTWLRAQQASGLSPPTRRDTASWLETLRPRHSSIKSLKQQGDKRRENKEPSMALRMNRPAEMSAPELPAALAGPPEASPDWAARPAEEEERPRAHTCRWRSPSRVWAEVSTNRHPGQAGARWPQQEWTLCLMCCHLFPLLATRRRWALWAMLRVLWVTCGSKASSRPEGTQGQLSGHRGGQGLLTAAACDSGWPPLC